MDFATKQFEAAALNTSPRAFSWCPISKTRIALVFTALIGTRNHYFVQIVDFVNSQPVYRKACYVCAVPSGAYTVSTMPRIARIDDNDLVLSVGTESTDLGMSGSHKFVLARFDNDGRVWYVAETPILQTSFFIASPAGSHAQIPKLVSQGKGAAYFFGNTLAQQSTTYYSVPAAFKIQVVGDAITVVNNGFSLTNGRSESAVPYMIQHATDLDGNIWVFIGLTNAIFWQIAPDDTLRGSNGSNFPFFDMQASLPIRANLFVKFTQNNAAFLHNVPNSDAHYLTGYNFNTISLLHTLMDKNVTYGHEDQMLLNNLGHFVKLVGVGSASLTNSSPSMQPADTAALTYANCALVIGRYNETDKSIETALTPVRMLDMQMTKRKYDKYLHQIDDRTIAVIGSFIPSDATVSQNHIVVVSI